MFQVSIKADALPCSPAVLAASAQVFAQPAPHEVIELPKWSPECLTVSSPGCDAQFNTGHGDYVESRSLPKMCVPPTGGLKF